MLAVVIVEVVVVVQYVASFVGIVSRVVVVVVDEKNVRS